MAGTTTSFVYLMAHNDEEGFCPPVKIGVASNPESRAHELQTGNPRKISLVATFEIKSRQLAGDIERAAHARAAGYRLTGEWFSLDIDFAAGAILAGMFNVFTKQERLSEAESYDIMKHCFGRHPAWRDAPQFGHVLGATT